MLVNEGARVAEWSDVGEVLFLTVGDAAARLGKREGGRRLVSVHSSKYFIC